MNLAHIEPIPAPPPRADDPLDRELEDHALWIVRLRWVAIAGVLLTTFVCREVFHVLDGFSTLALVGAAGAMAGYNAILRALPRRRLGAPGVALTQVVLDLTVLTAMLCVAGGEDNPFFLFYLFQVVIAGILLAPARAWLVTLLACALFAGMVGLRQSGAGPVLPLAIEAGDPETGRLHLGGNLVAFFAAAASTAYFTTAIVRKLRRRGAELLRANQDLALERKKTEDVVQSVGAALFVVDREHRVLWANEIARGWFGDAPIGDRCFGTIWAGEGACGNCPMGPEVGQVPTGTCERVLVQGDRRRSFLISTTPLRAGYGRDEAFLALVQDITSIKEMEIQLLQAGKMAAVGEFAAGIAHEINNPLAIVASSAELLAGTLPEHHAAARHLGRIEDGVFRCKEIVQNLLDFSRQEADTSEPVDVPDLLAESTRLLEGTGRARERTIVVEAMPERLRLERSRPRRIQQILLNLLLNAVDATGPGGTIRVGARRMDGEVEISVADDGAGIRPDDLGRLFEPFFTTKPPGKGTGLGLYVSRRIAEALGGTLSVESRPGEGATFRVALPAGGER